MVRQAVHEETRAPEAGALGSPRGTPWQVRLALLAAIWGMSFLFIKVGDEALAPLQVALGRMLFGTTTLLALLAARREPLPRGLGLWLHLAVSAVLLNALPFSLFAYGETQTTSVLAGIWNATTPLFTLPVAILLLRSEGMSREKLIGLLVGFAGVLLVFGVWQTQREGLIGNLLCLGAALSYGLGFPYARRFVTPRGHSALALAAGQLLCGTAELAIITPWLTHAPARLPIAAAGSVIVLGVLGTGIAHAVNYSLIRDAGATTASTVTYLIPFFSTVAGVLILGDALTWNEPLGGMVVIVGVAVSQGRLGRLARVWMGSRKAVIPS